MVHEHILNGEVVTLVQPNHIGAKWNQVNVIFRSSVWNYEGELISAGFPKFVNFGEKPEVFPVPTSLKGTVIVEKLDGSLLCVSKYKGKYIFRTRGTVDARESMDNGIEIDVFVSEMENNGFFDHYNDILGDTWNRSFLFEWLSPTNKIVISYGDIPIFKLIGIVSHHDYSMEPQSVLDTIANEFGISRPETYTFTSIDDLLSNVKGWVGREGVCLYSNNGQEIHKIKAEKYLLLHYMKSELSSTEKIMDVWLGQDMPSYSTFYDYISTTFDYELAEKCRGQISNICDAYKEVIKIIYHMKLFVENVKSLTTRKEQAISIISSYGNSNRAMFVFKILDGKQLEKDDIKKLLFQVMKN